MTPIANMNVYNDGMRKSMLDKIWFLDKIDGGIDTIYDYGCADGLLLKIVGEICPSMKLIGYDISQEMIDIAKQNVPNADYLSTNPKSDLHNTILNASSVFHEIHAYSSDIEWDYGNIFNSGATYIAIRDMFYSKRSCHPTNSIQLAKVLQHENPNKVSEFEAYNGLLVNNKDFLHYLLTYRYVENWDREVRENYFPHSIEEFLSKIPRQYEIVFYEHYTLPFLRDRVYEDFGFTLNDPTHAKILLRLIG
jgi:SAM-dependent methyltransferase